MANPLRGEVEFVQDGSTYVLVLGVNALCVAEALLSRKSHEISLAVSQGGDMLALRGLFWAALKDKHNLSLDEAGLLVQKLGVERVKALMVQAITAAFPSPEPAKPNPRKAARGTGRRSSANG